MHILISNDDGYLSPGLDELVQAASAYGEVSVVAPDRNRSGASNSLTLETPLRPVTCDNGYIRVDGTPTDCVHLAITGLIEEPDMVISGINLGANLGDDVLYSGTVAAAMEGRFLGLPAIAVSINAFEPEHLQSAGLAISVILNQLQTLGYEVDLAKNGQEALNRMLNKEYHLLLTDCNMPLVDGYKLAQTIRQRGDNALPIIAITAHAMRGDREAYLAAGMDEYVPKPIDRKVLLATIARTVDKRSSTPGSKGVVPSAEADRNPSDAAASAEPPSARKNNTTSAPAAAEDPDLPLIETKVIDEWRDFLGPEKFEELLTSHVAFAKSCIPLLHERGTKGTMQELAELAHDLKGTCASLGMVRVQQLAAELEAACKENRESEARDLLPSVETAVADGVAAIKQQYAA